MPDSRLLDRLVLARRPLERAAEKREDAEWLAAAIVDPATRVLVVHRGKARVTGDREGDGPLDLVLVAPSQAPQGIPLLLALEDDVVYVAVVVDAAADRPDADASWLDLREAASRLSDRDAGLMVAAVALANWHGTHPRCPRCGVPTEPSQGGWSRTCPDDGSQHFPRSDPAVIVLLTDHDDRALLGRRIDWPPGFFSTLAGFVEAGESAEAAVVRELAEEAGVDVDPDALDYLGSQPWPFPASLMLGYRARLAPGSRVAIPDGVEIAEVRWFTREEMHAAGEAGELKIPPTVSIARRLIEHWYGEELPASWSRP